MQVLLNSLYEFQNCRNVKKIIFNELIIVMDSVKSRILKHIIGYTVGIGIFIILIPAGIFYLSSLKTGIFKIPIIPNHIIRTAIFLILFIIGLIFVIWSNLFLFLKGKGGPTDIFGVKLSPQTKKLVVTGPYKYTRNPMVFGVYTTYISIAVYKNSPACLIILILMLLIIIYYIRSTEEKRLLKDFGEEYVKYKNSTPMIIPFLKKNRNP